MEAATPGEAMGVTAVRLLIAEILLGLLLVVVLVVHELGVN